MSCRCGFWKIAVFVLAIAGVLHMRAMKKAGLKVVLF